MKKRMSDEEVEDAAYQRLFSDLDGIRAGHMFSSDEGATQGAAPNAGTPGIEGIQLTVKPLMAAAQEGGRETPEEEEEEEKDRLKGIGKLSPLMEQLHGSK